MSSVAAVSSTEGCGRLWESLALQDVNVRLENLIQYSKPNDPNFQESIRREMEAHSKIMLDRVQNLINEKAKNWEIEKKLLNQTNHNLQNDVDGLIDEKKQFDGEKKNLMITNQKLQNELKKMTENFTTDNDAKIRHLQTTFETERKELVDANNKLNMENNELKMTKQNLENQNNNLKIERNSFQQQCRSLTQLLDDLRGQLQEEYKNEIENLKENLKGKIFSLNAKDLELKNLNTQYEALNSKFNDITGTLKNEITKLQQKNAELTTGVNKEFQEKLQSICRDYQDDLKAREKLWNKAKEESLQALNNAYRTLREGLGKQNDGLEDIIRKNEQEIQELKRENEKFKMLKKKKF